MVLKQGIVFSLTEGNVKNGHILEVNVSMSNKKYYVFILSFLLFITLISGVCGLEENKIKQTDNLVSLEEMSIQERIEFLNQKINEKDLSWVAGETSMSKLSKEERRARLGLIKPPF
jgi:flagellar biosynthesis/type III secretory pathway chaperone